jgi:hypothetical protein
MEKMGGRAMCQAIRAIFITDLRFLVTDLRDFQVRPVRMQYAFAVSVPLLIPEIGRLLGGRCLQRTGLDSLDKEFVHGRDGFRAVRLIISGPQNKEKREMTRRPSLPNEDPLNREVAIP